MRSLLVILGLIAVAFAVGVPKSCPTVYDGKTDGRFDLQTQFSTDSFSANWIFEEDVIQYEWAIVSESQFPHGSEQLGCRHLAGFFGIPDTMGWTNVKKSNSVTAHKLNLIPRTTYFAVLRTTLRDGSLIFSNSNGMIILPHLIMDSEKVVRDEIATDNNSMEGGERFERFTTADIPGYPSNTCPIDNANRCRQTQVSVNDILTEMYGPAVFVATPIFVTPAPFVESTSSGTTSDDDDGPWIAGIIIGALFLLALLLLLLALIGCLFVRGDGEDPFNTTVYSKDVEDVDADHGARVERTMGAENRVEFPDIDPHSRLSVAN